MYVCLVIIFRARTMLCNYFTGFFCDPGKILNETRIHKSFFIYELAKKKKASSLCEHITILRCVLLTHGPCDWSIFIIILRQFVFGVCGHSILIRCVVVVVILWPRIKRWWWRLANACESSFVRWLIWNAASIYKKRLCGGWVIWPVLMSFVVIARLTFYMLVCF